MTARAPRERRHAVIADLTNLNGKRNQSAEPIAGGSAAARTNVAVAFTNITNKRTRTEASGLSNPDTKKPAQVDKKLKAVSIVGPKEKERESKEARAKLKEQAKKEQAQWQAKYRVAIRTFIFFFDRVDVENEKVLSKELDRWGARIEQFFSRDITHIITSRPIPSTSNSATNSIAPNAVPPSPARSKRYSPYKLPQSPAKENVNSNAVVAPSRRTSSRLGTRIKSPGGVDRNPFEPTTGKREDLFLAKALAMGQKVWKVEKLHNVLGRLSDVKSPVKSASKAKPSLPTLLRTEARQGHTHERDLRVPRTDYYYFPSKSCFFLVEDSTEDHRPIHIKELDNPKHALDAVWPILWGGMENKPAFAKYNVMDTFRTIQERINQGVDLRFKERAEKEALKEKENAKALELVIEGCADNGESDGEGDRTVFAASKLSSLLPPAQIGSPRQHLRRSISMNLLQRKQSILVVEEPAGGGETSLETDFSGRVSGSGSDALPMMNITAAEHVRGPGDVFLAASGNSVSITSNIASGTSARGIPAARLRGPLADKKLAELDRRANFHMGGNHGAPTDAEGFKKPLNPALARVKKVAESRLKRSQSVESFMLARKKAEVKGKARKGKGVRAKLGRGLKAVDLAEIAAQEEPKPGYCENCRIKYEDFKTHVGGRRHRKWAHQDSNWAELDELLKRTTRVLKPGFSLPGAERAARRVAEEPEVGNGPSTPPRPIEREATPCEERVGAAPESGCASREEQEHNGGEATE